MKIKGTFEKISKLEFDIKKYRFDK